VRLFLFLAMLFQNVEEINMLALVIFLTPPFTFTILQEARGSVVFIVEQKSWRSLEDALCVFNFHLFQFHGYALWVFKLCLTQCMKKQTPALLSC